MSYSGMGQLVSEAIRRGGAQAVSASAPDWAGIERFARRAAGGMGDRFAGMLSMAERSNQQARHTASLRALADTIAVRPLAMTWLAQPAIRHRDGLIAIAEFARRSGRASAPLTVASPRTAQASGTVRAVGPTSSVRTATPPTASPMRSSADVETYLAQVRAELQKPRQQWHPDLVAVANAIEASKGSPQASMAMLKRVLSSTTGDARLVVAAMIVSIEQGLAMMQAMAAQAPSQPASPPPSTNLSPGGAIASSLIRGVSSSGEPVPPSVGNYTY